ncbi:MAG: polysaccharide deacetylase family protein [Deltaproteobacteria bacterium]|nr:polysaccharide deacetylase family protein [Deltaproteobacteria bacterium]
MIKKNKFLYKFFLIILLVFPIIATGNSSIDKIRYKIKSSDGNSLWEMMGGNGQIEGNEAKGKITFTFDDGPDHRTTPILLSMLDQYKIKAAFFVNGHRFHNRSAGGEENSALLREVYKRGHFIGNHTFSHKDITVLNNEQWHHEVKQVEYQVVSILGKKINMFRPPFGRTNSEISTKLKEDGYTIVMWNLDPLDWMSKNPEDLLNRFKKMIEENPDGGIVLMHDTNSVTIEAFPLLIEWINERNNRLLSMGQKGLEIVGLEEFIK